MAPDDLGLFRFTASVGTEQTTLHLVGVQTFADGTTKVWKTAAVEVAGGPAGSGTDTASRGLGAAALALAIAALAVGRRRRR